MEREGRLEVVKDALRGLVDGLDRDDSVAIVTFGDDARVRPAADRRRRRRRILAAIDELHPGGSTNLEAGLRLGYELARETLTENGIDRVVLASDGVANVGLTDPDGILERIRDGRRRRHRARRRSASAWATTTTPCSSSWPTRATASTPT